MKVSNKISIVLAAYCLLCIAFLKAEFKSMAQSNAISHFKLNPQQAKSFNVIVILIDAAKYSYWKE